MADAQNTVCGLPFKSGSQTETLLCFKKCVHEIQVPLYSIKGKRANQMLIYSKVSSDAADTERGKMCNFSLYYFMNPLSKGTIWLNSVLSRIWIKRQTCFIETCIMGFIEFRVCGVNNGIMIFYPDQQLFSQHWLMMWHHSAFSCPSSELISSLYFKEAASVKQSHTCTHM